MAHLQRSTTTLGKVQAQDLCGRVHPGRRVGQDPTPVASAHGEAVNLGVATHDGSPQALAETCSPDTYRTRLDNGEQELVVREPGERLGRQGERDGPIEARDQFLYVPDPVRSNDK